MCYTKPCDNRSSIHRIPKLLNPSGRKSLTGITDESGTQADRVGKEDFDWMIEMTSVSVSVSVSVSTPSRRIPYLLTHLPTSFAPAPTHPLTHLITNAPLRQSDLQPHPIPIQSTHSPSPHTFKTSPHGASGAFHTSRGAPPIHNLEIAPPCLFLLSSFPGYIRIRPRSAVPGHPKHRQMLGPRYWVSALGYWYYFPCM